MNYYLDTVGAIHGQGARSRPTGNEAVDAAIAARDAAQAELAAIRAKNRPRSPRAAVFTSQFADSFEACPGTSRDVAVMTGRGTRHRVKGGAVVMDHPELCRLMAGQSAVNVGPEGTLHLGPGRAARGGMAVNPGVFTAGGWNDALNSQPGVLYVRGADVFSADWFKENWLTLVNTGILIWLLIASFMKKK